jgi:hypothetical protein
MKRYASWTILAALLSTAWLPAAAKENAQPKYNVVEVKHMTNAASTDLPVEYLNGAYDRMREDLAKTGIFGKVVEDGGTISDADAANAVVLECKIVKFRDTRLAAGEVQAEVTLRSRGDQKLLQQFITKGVAINGGSWSNKARASGHNLAEEIKRNLK